jgi:hypothetical protein
MKKINSVLVHTQGNIYNQLFQYSLALFLLKNNKDGRVLLDTSFFNNLKEEFLLHHILLSDKISYKRLFVVDKTFIKINRILKLKIPIFFHKYASQEKDFFDVGRVCIDLYISSHDMLDWLVENSLPFVPKVFLSKQVLMLIDKIKTKESIAICIKGDSLEEQDFYKKALKHIKNKINKDTNLFVFIDKGKVYKDLNIDFGDVCVVEKREYISEVAMLYLLSLCNHTIISDDDFGFWGGILNKNYKKIIVAPKNLIKMKENFTADGWIYL